MLKFEVSKGKNQNLFALYLSATNREYRVHEAKNTIIFTVSKPHFSQDEVMLNMFYNVLEDRI